MCYDVSSILFVSSFFPMSLLGSAFKVAMEIAAAAALSLSHTFRPILEHRSYVQLQESHTIARNAHLHGTTEKYSTNTYCIHALPSTHIAIAHSNTITRTIRCTCHFYGGQFPEPTSCFFSIPFHFVPFHYYHCYFSCVWRRLSLPRRWFVISAVFLQFFFSSSSFSSFPYFFLFSSSFSSSHLFQFGSSFCCRFSITFAGCSACSIACQMIFLHCSHTHTHTQRNKKK